MIKAIDVKFKYLTIRTKLDDELNRFYEHSDTSWVPSWVLFPLLRDDVLNLAHWFLHPWYWNGTMAKHSPLYFVFWVSASNNYLRVSRHLLLRKSFGTGLAYLWLSVPEDPVLWVCVLRAPNSGPTKWDRIIFKSTELELQQNPKRSCLLIEDKVMLRILSTKGKRGVHELLKLVFFFGPYIFHMIWLIGIIKWVDITFCVYMKVCSLIIKSVKKAMKYDFPPLVCLFPSA